MVHAARTSAPRVATPPSPRHFLIGRTAIKIACNSPENSALNFSNRSKRACFGAHFAAHNSKISHRRLASVFPAVSNRRNFQKTKNSTPF
jgi:hypothetical protein